jgi:hypothetical protein
MLLLQYIPPYAKRFTERQVKSSYLGYQNSYNEEINGMTNILSASRNATKNQCAPDRNQFRSMLGLELQETL